MINITAACQKCGVVELSSRDMLVRVCTDNDRGEYLFRCPVCRMIQINQADDQVIDILVAAGVRYTEWRLPSELSERPSGGAITHDDAIDFHTIMAGDDWYDILTSMIERPIE